MGVECWRPGAVESWNEPVPTPLVLGTSGRTSELPESTARWPKARFERVRRRFDDRIRFPFIRATYPVVHGRCERASAPRSHERGADVVASPPV